MRHTFTSTLVELARRDSRIVLLTGDLGYQVLEPFATEFPDRFFNVGVAEQNMVGLATGLAEGGVIPFVYSIVSFAVLRPLEFIRNGPILHRLPVRIVGVGGGFDYGMNGISHYGLEDVAVLRAQPGISIIAPADHQQARRALEATWDAAGCVYYRLGREEKTVVENLDGRFEPGRLAIVREGQDLALITTGAIATEVAAAAATLGTLGVSCTVAIVASISPPPVSDIAALLERFTVAMTVEAHSTVGGLGSLVSEIAAERDVRCRIVRCGIRLPLDGLVGSPEYLHARHGLSRDALVHQALHECGRRRDARSVTQP
ncbi:MAG: transketolase family protein [Vicinamibacterales bacterium]